MALTLIALLVSAHGAHAISFDLDSIAAWGKFPRFCVDTYRWGDKFFNGYDTTYVEGTGYKFNVKLKTNSWLEYNTFRFDDNRYQMDMLSYPSTSAGVWLTYMAVSAGYDVNVSKLLGLNRSSRKRFNFQFNCMLFAADLYLQRNNSTMKICRFGPINHMESVDVAFDNVNSSVWGLDTYYFFNHKHYSQSAAFNYSRIQRKNSGSLFAGISVTGQSYHFNFSRLPQEMLIEIPESWPNYSYHLHAHNYAFKLGYGHNWALGRHFTIGVSEAPSVGVRYGYINNPDDAHTTFYGFNRFRLSGVYNSNHIFAGIIFQADTDLFSDRDHTLLTNLLSFEVSAGYRFNLW